MDSKKRLVSQATSARWILTIIAGGCLLLFTYTDCKSVLMGKPAPISVEAILSIITMVFVSYFAKDRPANNDTNGKGDQP